MEFCKGKPIYFGPDDMEETATHYREMYHTFLPPFDNIKFGRKIPKKILKEGYIKIDTITQQIWVNPFKCQCYNYVVYGMRKGEHLKENGEIVNDENVLIYGNIVLP